MAHYRDRRLKPPVAVQGGEVTMLVDEGIRYHRDDSLRIGKARRTINPRLRIFQLDRSWKRMEMARCAPLFDALSDSIV